METIFETLQVLGAVGGIIGIGWFVGMIVGLSIEGKANVWLVIGPLGVSILAIIVGYLLEVTFRAGIKSAIKAEEKSMNDEVATET